MLTEPMRPKPVSVALPVIAVFCLTTNPEPLGIAMLLISDAAGAPFGSQLLASVQFCVPAPPSHVTSGVIS